MIDPADHYRALVVSSDDAIIARDLDGRVISWNPAAERLYGYTAAEMIGQTMHCLISPAQLAEEEELLQRIRAGESPAMFTTTRRHRNGEEIEVALTISPIRDAAGTIIGASKIARDARPLLEAQRRAVSSEARFHILADNIPPLAWIARADGVIDWFSRRWYEFTGTNETSLTGQRYIELLHPDHAEGVMQRWNAAIAAGAPWEDSFPLRAADGSYRWFLARALPVRDEAGQIVEWFGSSTDITEQREQAEQIRLLLREVNHRSKNLLATVMALARRTARDGGADFVERFADRVRSLALNQDILVRREWREVPLAELVASQLAFVRGAAGELQVAGPDVALAPKAAETIGMALHELATNALKYGALSVSGGQVEVGWHLADGESDAPPLLLWWRESGGPPVAAPGHAGFGTTLIRDVPQHALGRVVLQFAPAGLCWELHCGPAALADAVNWQRKAL